MNLAIHLNRIKITRWPNITKSSPRFLFWLQVFRLYIYFWEVQSNLRRTTYRPDRQVIRMTFIAIDIIYFRNDDGILVEPGVQDKDDMRPKFLLLFKDILIKVLS